MVSSRSPRAAREDVEYRQDAHALFSIVESLAEQGELSQRALVRAGVDLANLEMSEDLRQSLEVHLPGGHLENDDPF